MSQLTIKISDKADALIAQLQKEIFNRRRKKVTAEGVVETLLESGAKSQSDKRFATSWQNLVADIEKAAMVAQSHGSKPSSLSDEEWAMVLSHRTRSSTAGESKRAAKPRATTRAKATTAAAPALRRGKATTAKSAAAAVELLDLASPPAKTRATRSAAKPKPARAAKAAPSPSAKPKAAATTRAGATTRKRSSAVVASAAVESAAVESAAVAKPKATAKPATRKTTTTRSSVARRMAKAASRLVSAPITTLPTAQTTPATPAANGSNGVDNGFANHPIS
jgi:hypothetical protein